ncbi:MAG: hypothetical protein GT601_05965 [Acidaminobacter sp.]|uniref:hypothetical protein n=1 Tax=Acidaminobacter sp. TaxID=1872102 RepID=UPI00138123C9|nr:hypothetical protein [Acidaminobacter sp.]MZQ97202.1 hypothetical protein [Acidaminobacter sp.]
MSKFDIYNKDGVKILDSVGYLDVVMMLRNHPGITYRRVNEMEYGTVTFEGIEYELTDQAEMTSRLLPYRKNYFEVEHGDEYDFEMSAPALKDGKKYMVYWIFSEIKGQEPEDLSGYDYSVVNRVEIYE